jgi:hypothetical protein
VRNRAIAHVDVPTEEVPSDPAATSAPKVRSSSAKHPATEVYQISV